MKKIKLGHSNIQVSAEGFGCMGMSEFYGPSSEKDAEKTISIAIDNGINFFDTADIYGYGHNEQLLGRILQEYREEQIVIATKCGIVRDINNPKYREVNNSKEYILKCFKDSSARLGRKIDLFYLHRVVKDPESIKNAMSAMFELRKDGRIGGIGLSEVSVETIKFAHTELLELSGGEFGLTAIQNEYSMLSRDIENNGVLDICDKLGISVVAYSPISRGLLGGELQNLNNLSIDDSRRFLPRFIGNNLNINNEIVNKLRTIAKDMGVSIAQLSLAWIMNKLPQIIPIPGTRTEKYLYDNIKSADIVLSQDCIERISELLSGAEIAGERYPNDFMNAYGIKK